MIIISPDALLLVGDRFLPNNSIITFTDIQDSLSAGLFCITNYTNCCRKKDGSKDGQWYSPSGSNVIQDSMAPIYMVRGPSKVVLHKDSNSENLPAGIYYCEIPLDVGLRVNFYVGLYSTHGGNTFSLTFIILLHSGFLLQLIIGCGEDIQ